MTKTRFKFLTQTGKQKNFQISINNNQGGGGGGGGVRIMRLIESSLNLKHLNLKLNQNQIIQKSQRCLLRLKNTTIESLLIIHKSNLNDDYYKLRL